MRARPLLLSTVLLLAAACGGGRRPPQWRPLEPAELAQAWREESRERFARAGGDFDGDGAPDTAFFLASPDGKRIGVSALLAASPDAHVLLEIARDELPGYGVRRAAPGEYSTFCGKTGECAPGEPDHVSLTTDAVEVFQHEGPVVLFVWDAATKRFVRHWISD